MASSGAKEPEKKTKLYSLYLYKIHDNKKATEVWVTADVQQFSFFQRSTIKESIKAVSRIIIERTEIGRRQSVQAENDLGMVHTWVHPDKIGGCVICNNEYPQRVAFQLLSDVIRIFLERFKGQWEHLTADTMLTFQEAADLFKKFQDPQEADKISKIEKNLDEVKETMVQSMDAIMQRGENLDTLLKKSDDLSDSSYQFYKQAKKNNRCCQMY